MNEPHTTNNNSSHNPWKSGAIGTGVALVVLVAAGLTFAALNDRSNQDDEAAAAVAEEKASSKAESAPTTVAAAPAAPSAQPAPQPAAPREDCGRYLAGTQRDNRRLLKDGAVGAMIGAGTGAAGGAIADGGSGAGKGAGIGAVVGAVAGTVHGLNQENQRVSGAERAYHDCVARNN